MGNKSQNYADKFGEVLDSLFDNASTLNDVFGGPKGAEPDITTAENRPSVIGAQVNSFCRHMA